jgi:hypothetical protein
MAFAKRFKNDFVLVENFKAFISALFPEDKPCTLLNSTTTKNEFVQFFAGAEYESFNNFEHSLKISKKRNDKKTKISEFINTHKLEIYPHSAYSIFLNDEKTNYEKKYPEMKLNDIRKIMTKDWSNMNDKQKEKFITVFKTKKTEFIQKVRDIDPEFVVYFDKYMAPKAPLRPYNIYVQENMKIIKEANPKMTSSDIMKEIGKKWKALSEDDKKKYYDACNTEVPTTKTSTTSKTATKTTTSSTPVTSKTTETAKPKTDKKKKHHMSDEDSDVIEEEKKPKAKSKAKLTTSISDTEESDADSKPKNKTTKGKTTSKAASKIDEILDDNDE